MSAKPETIVPHDSTAWSRATRESPWRTHDRESLALWDLIEILLQAQRATQAPRSQRPPRTRLWAQVARGALWARDDMKRDLLALLESFFAERFTVEFAPRPENDQHAATIAGSEYGSRQSCPATVIAFSPDLDSVAGFLASGSSGRGPATLVTLDADTSMARVARQVERQRCLERVTAPGTVHTVAGSLVVDAHRSRVATTRLLHLVWTAVVALQLGCREIQFFENGIDNLQLPLGMKTLAARRHAASVGADATRTVSPETAAILQHLFSECIDDELQIHNPFSDRTPSEVARSMVASGRGLARYDAINELVGESPHHTREMTADHCIAMLGALAARRQPLHGDTPVSPSDLIGLHESVAAAYVANIRTLSNLSGQALIARLMTLGMAVTETLTEPRRLEMIGRHVATVSQVLVDLVRDHAISLVAGELPDSSLVVQAAMPAQASRRVRGPDASSPTFRRHGTCWELRDRDGASAYINHIDGMSYIHILLQNANRMHSAQDLRWQVTGRPARVGTGDGDLSDDEAIATYLHTVRQRRGALQQAQNDNDASGAEKIVQEIGWLEREISRSRGLGGRRRDASDREQARKSVCNAVQRALTRIARECPELAEHLKSSIRLGHTLCYAPHQPTDWLT